MAQGNRNLAAKAAKSRTQAKYGVGTPPTQRWAEASVNGTSTPQARVQAKAMSAQKPLSTTRRERSLLRILAAFK